MRSPYRKILYRHFGFLVHRSILYQRYFEGIPILTLAMAQRFARHASEHRKFGRYTRYRKTATSHATQAYTFPPFREQNCVYLKLKFFSYNVSARFRLYGLEHQLDVQYMSLSPDSAYQRPRTQRAAFRFTLQKFVVPSLQQKKTERPCNTPQTGGIETQKQYSLYPHLGRCNF